MGILIIIILIIIIFLIKDTIKKNKKVNSKSPSGPFAFPILGNIIQYCFNKFFLNIQEHSIIERYSRKYDGICRMWLGGFLFLFVSNYEIVKCFQKEENFFDRPSTFVPTWRYMSSNGSGIMSSNDEKWKRAKTTFLKSLKIHGKKNLIEEKSIEFVNSIKKFANSKQVFNPKQYSQGFSSSIFFKLMFNEDISIDSKFLKEIGTAVGMVFTRNSSLTVFDFFEILSPFYDLFFKFRLKPVEILRKTIEKQLINHLNTMDTKMNNQQSRDIMDDLIIEYGGLNEISNQDRIQIMQICFDVMSTDIGTVGTTIDWVFLQLSNRQDLQEIIYNEIKDTIKIKRYNNLIDGSDVGADTDELFISLSDKQSIPYLIAFIKETMRFFSNGWSLPKTSKHDQICGNYFIPNGSVLFINYYSIHKNEEFFKNPNEFNPDRYLDDSIPIPDLHFGIGQRGCPGRFLAMDQLFICIANILLKFKIKSIDGKKIDDSIQFSVYLKPKDFEILLEKRN
ncbi:hypothetical protein ACTFIZ_000911 [Dictyostelium cf. discoideum]